MSTSFEGWRRSLEQIHGWFLGQRRRSRYFALKAFAVFVVINLACFWLALSTAFPEKLTDHESLEHALMSLPIAVMGALFDVASLGVTLWAISRALGSRSNGVYLAFLGVDIVIAVLATFWVLFAFVVSGWLVGHVIPVNETLADRTELYQGRLLNALLNPFSPESIKNVYFGMVMGASAMIPTIMHFLFAFLAFARAANRLVVSR